MTELGKFSYVPMGHFYIIFCELYICLSIFIGFLGLGLLIFEDFLQVRYISP